MVHRDRVPHFVLVLALLVSLVAVTASARPAAATGPVTYSIGGGVSAEDESYVREGIRLAQDFLLEELGVEVEDRIIVNARATAPPEQEGLIAVAGIGWVGIYTGSEGWIDSPPFWRVEVVIHEYVHTARHALLGDDAGDDPTWLDEGISEALAFRSVISRDLVTAEEVAAMQTAVVLMAGFLEESVPPLNELETVEGWETAGGPTYALAGLAVTRLIDEAGATSIRRYDEELARGRSWQSAFATAFGQTAEAFYEAFAAERAALVLPDEFPLAFSSVSPTDHPAAVTLNVISTSIAPGAQALVRAGSEPNARCTLVVSSPDGEEIVTLPTFVDGAGRVFWLWSVPSAAQAGAWPVAITCGDVPVETILLVQAETSGSNRLKSSPPLPGGWRVDLGFEEDEAVLVCTYDVPPLVTPSATPTAA